MPRFRCDAVRARSDLFHKHMNQFPVVGIKRQGDRHHQRVVANCDIEVWVWDADADAADGKICPLSLGDDVQPYLSGNPFESSTQQRIVSCEDGPSRPIRDRVHCLQYETGDGVGRGHFYPFSRYRPQHRPTSHICS